MQPEIIVILSILVLFITLEILFTRFFDKPGQRKDDAIVEIFSTTGLLLVSQPLTIMGGGYLASRLAPGAQDMLAACGLQSAVVRGPRIQHR